MKFTLRKDQIAEGLQKAANIIPAKTGAAYLRLIWLKAENSSLSIMTTDANMEFTGVYSAEVEEPGLAGVQGRAFVDLVRLLPDGNAQLSLDKNGTYLLIEQGRRNYRMPVSNQDWFKDLSAFPEENSVRWTGGVFRDCLEKVSFLIQDGEDEGAMGCVCFKPRGDGKIDACGMDGHKFAMISFINDDLAALLPDSGMLIQKKYIGDLIKWLNADELELNLTEKHLYLRRIDQSETISLPLANYEYPDYNVFMSKFNDGDTSKLILAREDVLETLARFKVFYQESRRNDSKPPLYIETQPGKSSEACFSARSSEGSARENLEVAYDGTISKISFPIDDLFDIFGHFSSPEIEMVFTAEEGPCAIKGAEDTNYIVILMPMRVSENAYYEEEDNA